MNIPPQNLSFKGYDAAPLKSIYLEETDDQSAGFHKEIKEICKKENVEPREIMTYFKWIQDIGTIIEDRNKPAMAADVSIHRSALPYMENKYGIQGRTIKGYITGGNSFIGKLPSGEKWLMAGRQELKNNDLELISRQYGINIENIYPITNPNFHLDLFIRPIGYPYVLVNDPKLAEEILDKMNDGSEEFKKIKNNFNLYEEARCNKYASCDSVCRELEDKGFIPIRIAGVFGSYVNFMNGIVNKHKDGKISYITNSSNCDNPYYSKLQKMFENKLREKVDVDKIYFIEGGNYCGKNRIMEMLDFGHGGVHCMTMEEPDFKAWA